MEMIDTIPVKKVRHSRISEMEGHKLDFGSFISDHMFYALYKNDEWQDAEVRPFENLSLSPATLALHYGQSIFEGMKAFRMKDGNINIFRLDKHLERLNRSLHRMCMPEVSDSLFRSALIKLIETDHAWVPSSEGSALYIRPFIFASEAKFGVKVADEYTFIIFTGPVAPVFQKPIKLKVEREYIRAARGGTGFAKCAGNYGGAFYPTQLAREEGYDQLLWTDARQHEFIEESGMMNAMFVIDGVLCTPPLSDSILDGITRDSLLKVASMAGIKVEERPVSINELIDGIVNKKLTEAFGAGTAAVVAPVSVINIDGTDFFLPEYKPSSIMFRLRDRLDLMRYGKEADVFEWNNIVSIA